MKEKELKNMEIELKEAEKIRVLNSEDLFYIMQKILQRESHLDQEKKHLWVVALDGRNKILLIELVSLGGINRKELHPSEIYSFALQKEAKKIILCHNNADGSLQPNEVSKDVTDWMIQVGLLVNTPVYDHLVVSTTSYMSFKASGLLAELEKSTKYVIPRELERRTREEEQKKAKIEAEYAAKKANEEKLEELQQNRLDIAYSMKEKGYPIDEISALTGLTEGEIKGL
jgi:DNA repair protein RadC